MATPILDITEVADGQIDQFAIYNEALRDLEASENAAVSLDLSASDLTVTAEQMTRNKVFVTTGNAVSRTLSFPARIRNFLVRNTGSATLIVSIGSTTINVATLKTRMFQSDGATNGLVLLDLT